VAFAGTPAEAIMQARLHAQVQLQQFFIQHEVSAAPPAAGGTAAAEAAGGGSTTVDLLLLQALRDRQPADVAAQVQCMEVDVRQWLVEFVEMDLRGSPISEEEKAQLVDTARAAAGHMHLAALGLSHYGLRVDKDAAVGMDIGTTLSLASRLGAASSQELGSIMQQLQRGVGRCKQHHGSSKSRERQEALDMQVVTLGMLWEDQGRVQL
jgi:hypothetical protein